MRNNQKEACELDGADRLRDALGAVVDEVENVIILKTFVDHTIDDLALVSNWREAERMLDRLLSVAERLTGEQVTRIIENTISNNQVHRSRRMGDQMGEFFRRTVLRAGATKASWIRFYRFISYRQLPSDVSEIQQLIELTMLNK